MDIAKNVEQFLAAYETYRCQKAAPEHGKILRVHDMRDGSYVSERVELPEELESTRDRVGIITAKMRAHSGTYGLTAVPVFEFAVVDPQQPAFSPRVRGVEIDDRIYAIDNNHAFNLFFKVLPGIAARKRDTYYFGTNIKAADHPRGDIIGHIYFREEEGRDVFEADFVHNGNQREYEFFVQVNPDWRAARALGEAKPAVVPYLLAGPVSVPKASLRNQAHEGSLQHLLETFRF